MIENDCCDNVETEVAEVEGEVGRKSRVGWTIGLIYRVERLSGLFFLGQSCSDAVPNCSISRQTVLHHILTNSNSNHARRKRRDAIRFTREASSHSSTSTQRVSRMSQVIYSSYPSSTKY